MKRFGLSKSKILAGLQCPKRLWLEVHGADQGEDSQATQALFRTGNRVGEVARTLFPAGVLIEHVDDLPAALQETERALVGGRQPLFEGAFSHERVLVRADVLLPRKGGARLIEVKASTSVEDHHLQDCAVQDWVLAGAGVEVKRIDVATVDTGFVYAGDGNYAGLFKFLNVTGRVRKLRDEIPDWVREFRRVLAGPMPEVEVGPQCASPYECPFLGQCAKGGPEYPVEILPRGGKVVEALLRDGYRDVREIPEGRLENEVHERVRAVTAAGKPFVSRALAKILRSLPYPRYYLDFETVNPAVPIWADTRPYEQLPFQWSCHIESRDGSVEHHEFLNASGMAPMRGFTESLLRTLRARGPIVVYSGFEKRILRSLAKRFPDIAQPIDRAIARLFDLLPVLQEHYYHPEMRGSWSIKNVLPTVAPDLGYDDLATVQDGGQAQRAFEELLSGSPDPIRRDTLLRALLNYCKRDSSALHAVTHTFSRELRRIRRE